MLLEIETEEYRLMASSFSVVLVRHLTKPTLGKALSTHGSSELSTCNLEDEKPAVPAATLVSVLCVSTVSCSGCWIGHPAKLWVGHGNQKLGVIPLRVPKIRTHGQTLSQGPYFLLCNLTTLGKSVWKAYCTVASPVAPIWLCSAMEYDHYAAGAFG